MLRSADSFYRRGSKLLVVAKFIPGINPMAPPLAGGLQMRFSSFLRLDLAGAALYVGVYFGLGFVFNGALHAVTQGYRAFGRIVGAAGIALVVAYLGFQLWLWVRERLQQPVTYAIPLEAAEASWRRSLKSTMSGVMDILTRMPFASRDPSDTGPMVASNQHQDFSTVQQVYLYCTCVREATSRRVARELASKVSRELECVSRLSRVVCARGVGRGYRRRWCRARV